MSELEPHEPIPPPAPVAPAVRSGWYPDPRAAGVQRYWDGGAWTEHVAAMPPVASPAQLPVQPTLQPVYMMNQPRQAVTLKKRTTNHTFHLIMSILTSGIWALFVWLPIIIWHAIAPKRREMTYYS